MFAYDVLVEPKEGTVLGWEKVTYSVEVFNTGDSFGSG